MPAGGDVAGPLLEQRRGLGDAELARKGAAAREGTARDRLRQHRDDAGDLGEPRPPPGLLGVEVEARDGAHQPARVGVRRPGEELLDARPSTLRPAYMTMTRCAVSAITPRSWVIMTIAAPSFSFSSSIRSRIWAWMVTSSAVVGSSATSTRGSQESAIAIIAR